MRRALLVVIALGGVSLLYTATRYARMTQQADTTPATADGEKVTLRFYRDPKPVPAFTALDLDGRQVSTTAFQGKVVIVNFWATWCGPCRAEIPDLVKLQDKYRDQLQIIGVSEDEAPPETVKRFAQEFHVNYPVVMTTPEIEKLYPGISALPTSFIVDRSARIVQKHVGMLTARTTEYETRSLAGLPVDVTIEQIDQSQGLKLALGSGAQAMTIPGIDLTKLSPAKRMDALQKLNGQPCTCGCDLTVARCRVDDPTCGVSLPLAREIVKQVAATPN
jgi:thiol-disulfide isomerase/thioredoxin